MGRGSFDTVYVLVRHIEHLEISTAPADAARRSHRRYRAALRATRDVPCRHRGEAPALHGMLAAYRRDLRARQQAATIWVAAGRQGGRTRNPRWPLEQY